MLGKLNIFKRIKELETSVDVLEDRCGLYEGLVSEYVMSQVELEVQLGELISTNQRLVNILNEHLLDDISKVEKNNSSLQTVRKTVEDITLKNGLGEPYKIVRDR